MTATLPWQDVVEQAPAPVSDADARRIKSSVEAVDGGQAPEEVEQRGGEENDESEAKSEFSMEGDLAGQSRPTIGSRETLPLAGELVQ